MVYVLKDDNVNLLTSELITIIKEANLGEVNKQIAYMRLIKGMTFVEIGAELHKDRTCVAKRFDKCLDKIEKTAIKLGYLKI